MQNIHSSIKLFGAINLSALIIIILIFICNAPISSDAANHGDTIAIQKNVLESKLDSYLKERLSSITPGEKVRVLIWLKPIEREAKEELKKVDKFNSLI